jgi:hypothetical protein
MPANSKAKNFFVGDIGARTPLPAIQTVDNYCRQLMTDIVECKTYFELAPQC